MIQTEKPRLDVQFLYDKADGQLDYIDMIKKDSFNKLIGLFQQAQKSLKNVNAWLFAIETCIQGGVLILTEEERIRHLLIRERANAVEIEMKQVVIVSPPKWSDKSVGGLDVESYKMG